MMKSNPYGFGVYLWNGTNYNYLTHSNEANIIQRIYMKKNGISIVVTMDVDIVYY